MPDDTSTRITRADNRHNRKSPYRDSQEELHQFQETKPVNPKGNQPQIFTGNTDAEAEALILWPADVDSHIS